MIVGRVSIRLRNHTTGCTTEIKKDRNVITQHSILMVDPVTPRFCYMLRRLMLQRSDWFTAICRKVGAYLNGP